MCPVSPTVLFQLCITYLMFVFLQFTSKIFQQNYLRFNLVLDQEKMRSSIIVLLLFPCEEEACFWRTRGIAVWIKNFTDCLSDLCDTRNNCWMLWISILIHLYLRLYFMRAGRDFYCFKSVVSPVFPSLKSAHAGQYQGLLGEEAALQFIIS